YWAKILLGRADKLDAHLALKPMRYVNSLINQVDRMIETRDDSLLDDSYFEEDLLANLRNSTFIYCTVEQRSAGDELVTLLKTLTHEEGVLFDNGSEFIAKLKEIHSTDYVCPIIISANIKNETNILKELSSIACVHQIYILSIRDHPSVTESDQMLLEEFANVHNIYYQARALALQWVAERASICERIGEFCAENMSPQCKEIIEYYANFKGEIDIFLPHHAIVMVNIYASPTNVRRRFYLYCDTDGFVTEYKRYQRSKLCEQVFHINELEDRLYKKAHKHIFNYLTLLQARAEDGDIDAEDLKLPVSELLLASAEKINDIIRQTAGLPEQPVEII
ncbi:unnamed protein product, partial [Adineta ricciae]